jgi:hypothetical protein
MTDLFVTLAQIIAHTPFWVWLILLFLIWRGLGSTVSRDAGLTRLLLMPSVLLCLTLWSVLSSGLSTAILAGLILGVLAGVAAGLVLERRNPATNLGNGRIRLPGEWTTLMVILVVFATRYIRIVTGIMAPDLAASAPFLIVMGAFSAFNTAMLLTRTALRLRVMQAPVPLAA